MGGVSFFACWQVLGCTSPFSLNWWVPGEGPEKALVTWALPALHSAVCDLLSPGLSICTCQQGQAALWGAGEDYSSILMGEWMERCIESPGWPLLQCPYLSTCCSHASCNGKLTPCISLLGLPQSSTIINGA